MTAALWQWDELVAAAAAEAEGAPTAAVTGFSIDTRSLGPGDVFVALTDQRDGHDFVGKAFEAGAVAAIVRCGYSRQPGDGALLRVEDVLAALRGIARSARARLAGGARIIAVTGSAGKTTTKEMLRGCLDAVAPGKVHASIKSYNNHWGVPLMLANMPADVRFGVFEIGMNHAGEITPLTALVRPHVAVVTNVLPVHVGNFADGETGVAKAKAEIFAGLEPGGVAVIPADSRHGEVLRGAAEQAHAQVRTFSFSPGHGADLEIARTLAGYPEDVPTYFVRARDGGAWRFALGLRGEHVAADALAALLAIEACGADPRVASTALAAMGAPPGRGERVALRVADGAALLIDESYNANPASMTAAIRTAAATLRGDDTWQRLVLVLGEMLELGADAARYHEGLLADVEAARQFGATTVFACGPNMRRFFDAAPVEMQGEWAATAGDLEPAVLAALRPGDVVMVKGSNGAKTWAIAAAIKKRFATLARQG